MRIVIAGGTGFLGRALSDALSSAGHDVVVLTRHSSSATAEPSTASLPHHGVRLAHWQPDGSSGPWSAFLDDGAAVVNLAGESIGEGRWTDARKRRMRDSRLDATGSLVAAMRACRTQPAVFISMSAVGYYGTHHGDQILTEASPPGSDYLARLCVDWEATAARAASAAQRTVILRTGLVLDRQAGALPRMLLPFRLFAGGPIASGRQYMSWIHLQDWLGLVTWLIREQSAAGPINATAPEPSRNRDFMRVVGQVLRRPWFMPAPAFALRLLLGEMAESLVIGGQRVVPERALALGYRFRFTELRSALEDVLKTGRR